MPRSRSPFTVGGDSGAEDGLGGSDGAPGRKAGLPVHGDPSPDRFQVSLRPMTVDFGAHHRNNSSRFLALGGGRGGGGGSGGLPGSGSSIMTPERRESRFSVRRPTAMQLIGLEEKLNLQQYAVEEKDLARIKSKKIRVFYSRQNELIRQYRDMDMIIDRMSVEILQYYGRPGAPGSTLEEQGSGNGVNGLLGRDLELGQSAPTDELSPLIRTEGEDSEDRMAKVITFAININMLANVVLLAFKVFATIQSSSLSLLAGVLDSLLDLLSSLIVFVTSKMVADKSSGVAYKYPVGRARLEPMGVVIFSVIMITSFAQVIIESVQRLASDSRTVPELPRIAVIAMLVTIFIKGLLWVYSARIDSTSVQALAQDAATDVKFNLMSLIFPLIAGAFSIWWLDSAGAIVLSIYIAYEWGATCFHNVRKLSGHSANPNDVKPIIYLAYRFSPLIQKLKSVNAYYSGDGLWVEIDVVFNENQDLRTAHDISETLQYCCEAVPGIERAFIHCDYESNPVLGGHGKVKK